MKYWVESSYDFEDKEQTQPEYVVVGCDGGDELGTMTVATFPLEVRGEVEDLVNHFNDPQF